MEIFTNFIDGVINIFTSLDPSTVDFSSIGDVMVYIFQLGIVLTILGALFYSIYKFPEFIQFLKSTYRELKLADWLERVLIYKYTLLVLVFTIFCTLFILLTDQTFLNLRNLLI